MKTKAYKCTCGHLAYYISRRGWFCACNNPKKGSTMNIIRGASGLTLLAFVMAYLVLHDNGSERGYAQFKAQHDECMINGEFQHTDSCVKCINDCLEPAK